MSSDKIKLTVQHGISLQDEDPLNADSFKLWYKILETSREDVPIELFLFRQRLNQQHYPRLFTGNADWDIKTIDCFSTVCSASDIYSYPVNKPDPNSRLPFFRKSEYTLVLESLNECYNVLHKTDYLLEILLESIRNIENAVETPPRIIEA
jgi:hypothetical protein